MNKYDIDDEKEIALDDKDFILEVDDFELPVELPLPSSESGEKKVDMNDLIAKGKKGSLSVSDLEEAMEEFDYDTDKLYDTLESNGIAIPIDISQSEMTEIENEVEKFNTGENMERLLEQEGLAIDDPDRKSVV